MSKRTVEGRKGKAGDGKFKKHESCFSLCYFFFYSFFFLSNDNSYECDDLLKCIHVKKFPG